MQHVQSITLLITNHLFKLCECLIVPYELMSHISNRAKDIDFQYSETGLEKTLL